jgi:hypothetical protein
MNYVRKQQQQKTTMSNPWIMRDVFLLWMC